MNAKVILITGASSGMGLETAKLLASQGHRVYAAARSAGKMEGLKKHGIVPMALDVTKEDEIPRVVQSIMEAEKRIDVLINNAGFGLYGTVEDTPMKEARYQFDVNLFGLAALTQAVLPYMRARNSGRIINTSSMGGKIYTPLGAWYHATKHALEGWSDCLRLEVKKFNIDVVLIEPGLIKTNFAAVVAGKMAETTRDSAYGHMIEPYVKMMSDPEAAYRGTEPVVLARVFAKAATVKKPKTRYMKGLMAKPLVWIRNTFGDRVYDAVISRAFG